MFWQHGVGQADASPNTATASVPAQSQAVPSPQTERSVVPERPAQLEPITTTSTGSFRSIAVGQPAAVAVAASRAPVQLDATSSIRTRPMATVVDANGTATASIARLSFAPTATATAQASAASPLLHDTVVIVVGAGFVVGTAWYFLRDCPSPATVFVSQVQRFVTATTSVPSKAIVTQQGEVHQTVFAAAYEVSRVVWGWYPAARAAIVAMGPLTLQNGASALFHQLDITRRLLRRGLTVRWWARSGVAPLSLQERHLRKRMAVLISVNTAISCASVAAAFGALWLTKRIVSSVTTEYRLGHAVGFYMSQLSQRGLSLPTAYDALLKNPSIPAAVKLRSTLRAALPFVPSAYPDVTAAALLHAWTCWGHVRALQKRLDGTVRALRSLLREPLLAAEKAVGDDGAVESDDDDDVSVSS